MTTKLFFDTETTGTADFNAPASAPHQPHIVQLAAVLTDEEGKIFGRVATLIQPDGWTIDEGAQKVHGITLEECERYGVPIRVALAVFSHLARRASVAIAFNCPFDKLMLEREFLQFGPPPEWFTSVEWFCEMRAMEPICKIPFGGRIVRHRTPGQAYKWPNLSEAHGFATGMDFTDKHDALGDVHAMIRVHFWRLERERTAIAPGLPGIPPPVTSITPPR